MQRSLQGSIMSLLKPTAGFLEGHIQIIRLRLVLNEKIEKSIRRERSIQNQSRIIIQ